jgi:hypothetical protein
MWDYTGTRLKIDFANFTVTQGRVMPWDYYRTWCINEMAVFLLKIKVTVLLWQTPNTVYLKNVLFYLLKYPLKVTSYLTEARKHCRWLLLPQILYENRVSSFLEILERHFTEIGNCRIFRVSKPARTTRLHEQCGSPMMACQLKKIDQIY